MQQKVSFWTSMAMLICIGVAALIIALHASGMPISGWGLICSVEDADVVSCFRDWITSGAAVLTGVAIVFAVAQVREANRQGDAATRASLVHFKGELVAEMDAMNSMAEAIDGLAVFRSAPVARLFTKEGKDNLVSKLDESVKELGAIDPFLVTGVAVGDLAQARTNFANETRRLRMSLATFMRPHLIQGKYDDGILRAASDGLPNLIAQATAAKKVYAEELAKALSLATDKIARLDAEIFSERH